MVLLVRTVVLGLLLSCSTVLATAETTVRVPPVLLQMIRDDAVHTELDLSGRQREQLLQLLPEIDGRWFRARNLPDDQQQTVIKQLTTELRQSLSSFLDDAQLKRLAQLERQALGTRMVLRDDVSTDLDLTQGQLDRFREAFVETDNESNRIQQELQQGKQTPQEAQSALERLKNRERKALVAQLSSEQRQRIASLTGDAFDFSKVRRMYPLAPELRSEGVTWIQGGPLKLDELRGKVVAVHFYAFQCINCKRNLPHYDAWHQDYADKGLVVIGIQTPETESEKRLDRVAEAAKQQGIEYPLLLDAEAANWKSWSNTMWPTVYLIDKQGFIRRWWQGEMNWQGTPGEKQMRTTIEALLAE